MILHPESYPTPSTAQLALFQFDFPTRTMQVCPPRLIRPFSREMPTEIYLPSLIKLRRSVFCLTTLSVLRFPFFSSTLFVLRLPFSFVPLRQAGRAKRRGWIVLRFPLLVLRLPFSFVPLRQAGRAKRRGWIILRFPLFSPPLSIFLCPPETGGTSEAEGVDSPPLPLSVLRLPFP